jgi:hypothetical protein
MATRKKASLPIELDDLGRPARPTVPDPRKIGSNRLGQRLLPIQSVETNHWVVGRHRVIKRSNGAEPIFGAELSLFWPLVERNAERALVARCPVTRLHRS